MDTVTLGPSGTYSHRAASAVSAGDVSFMESVRDIVDAVAVGDADRGVVPIENSIQGSVTETLDALADTDGLAVVREVVTPIRHALLAQGDGFDAVASHAQALAQCREYLDATHPAVDRRAVASTARGVGVARNDETTAAIAHPDSADGTDLDVHRSGIQDRASNETRFFVVGPASERTPAGGKSSIIVYPNANHPGLLLELLEPFADRNINLSRVESRPSGERLGDYVFHVDIASGCYEERTRNAVADVAEIAAAGWVRRLGSYDTEHVA
ncbi:prephenate dehydratase [Halobacterium salinarum]|uniref:prephenate dehydratase n=1 Tax=Halobacterium TaxID=2239 RepID=UPI0025556676|nr:prephenate dehydratase [Halobacterium salinarum]MDL0139507.1 prephenate dehydratase [Halobacterium salinarum]